MAILATYAYCNSTCGAEKPTARGPHFAAETVGKSVVALAFVGGVLAVLGLAIAGALGYGPFAQLLSFKANVIIAGAIGGFEVLTLIGLGLRALGFGADEAAPKDDHRSLSTERKAILSTEEATLATHEAVS